jgi:hypothetical protein
MINLGWYNGVALSLLLNCLISPAACWPTAINQHQLSNHPCTSFFQVRETRKCIHVVVEEKSIAECEGFLSHLNSFLVLHVG